jgi:hypothetical protein
VLQLTGVTDIAKPRRETCRVSWLNPPGPLVELKNQWSCESVRGSVSLLRLPAFAKPRLTM